MNRKATVVGLAVVGATAAIVLGGGLLAGSVVTVTDLTNTAVGAGVAESACETPMTIKAGLARYDATVKNFVIRDVTVGDIAPQCSGLNGTVVGLDAAGNPVVEGAAVSASPSFTVGLSNGITLDSVTEWRVVLQDIEGYAGTSVSAPALGGNVVPAVQGDVEPLPTAAPTAAPSPSSSSSVGPSPAPSGTAPAMLPTSDSLPQPTPTPTPTPTS